MFLFFLLFIKAELNFTLIVSIPQCTITFFWVTFFSRLHWLVRHDVFSGLVQGSLILAHRDRASDISRVAQGSFHPSQTSSSKSMSGTLLVEKRGPFTNELRFVLNPLCSVGAPPLIRMLEHLSAF